MAMMILILCRSFFDDLAGWLVFKSSRVSLCLFLLLLSLFVVLLLLLLLLLLLFTFRLLLLFVLLLLFFFDLKLFFFDLKLFISVFVVEDITFCSLTML